MQRGSQGVDPGGNWPRVPNTQSGARTGTGPWSSVPGQGPAPEQVKRRWPPRGCGARSPAGTPTQRLGRDGRPQPGALAASGCEHVCAHVCLSVGDGSCPSPRRPLRQGLHAPQEGSNFLPGLQNRAGPKSPKSLLTTRLSWGRGEEGQGGLLCGWLWEDIRRALARSLWDPARSSSPERPTAPILLSQPLRAPNVRLPPQRRLHPLSPLCTSLPASARRPHAA